MEIVLYNGFSKRINSTKRPSGGTSVNALLKKNTSVVAPIFELTNFDTSVNYIKWGNRYYFVDDIAINTNNIAEYICSLDVLATYKDVIGSSSQYVLRSSAAFDGNVIDSKYPTKANPTHQGHILTNIDATYDVNSSGTYILGVKNADAKSGLCYYALDSEISMPAVMRYLFSDVWLDATDITKSLQKLICNPMDYVSSCYWYPFTYSGDTSEAASVKFGYWDTGVPCYEVPESKRNKFTFDMFNLSNHPQIARGNYLNGAPYTQLMLDCYGFGRIPIDANYFMRARAVEVRLFVDLFTGIGELTVEGTTGRIVKESAMVGVPVQLSQVTQDLIKPVFDTLGAVTSFANKDIIGGLNGISDALMSTLPQIRSSGSTGSKIAYKVRPSLNQIFYELADEDNATIGRPLCEVRTISSLNGYIECANVDIDSVGTPREKNAIINYMQGGFFYE